MPWPAEVWITHGHNRSCCSSRSGFLASRVQKEKQLNIHDFHQAEINRVAETHYLLRWQLASKLKESVITPEGKAFVGDYDTYHDFWCGTYGDRFFDMTTMIRLGTAVEQNLKRYYMHRKGYATLAELRTDPSIKKGIFQRVQSWQDNGVIPLYERELGYDLKGHPHLKPMQEMMTHRHLYGHNSGLLDDEYIENILEITGEDVRTLPTIAESRYPDEDVYWFEPLKKLNHFIEEARRFFRSFP